MSTVSSAVITEGNLLTGWRYRAVVITLLLAAAGYLGVSIWVGWDEMLVAIRQFGWGGLAVSLSLTLVSLMARFSRWQLYLYQLKANIPWESSLRIYIGGLALTATPGKAGEAVRGIFLKRHGTDHLRSLSIFFADRFTDLIAVMLLAASGVWNKPEAWPAAVVLLVIILLVLALIQYPRLFTASIERVSKLIRWQRIKKLLTHASHILGHCNILFTPKIFIAGLFLALLAWGLEAINYFFIIHFLQAEILFSTAVFIYAFAKLVGAISMIPGGFGSTEATLVALLVFNGVDETTAVAAALLLRLTTFWFVVTLGMIALPKK